MQVPESNSFQLREFYDAVFRRKKTILYFFLVVVTATIAGVYLWPETYSAESKILVKVGRENVSATSLADSTRQQVVTAGVRKEDINTEIAILASWQIAEQVVDELGRGYLFPEAERPKTFFKQLKYYAKRGFKKVRNAVLEVLYVLDLKKRLSEQEQAVSALHKRINARLEASSDVIKAEVQWGDPSIARAILARVLDIYLQRHLEAHKQAGGYEFLEEQVQLARKRLYGAEEKLRKLRDRQGIVAIDLQKKLLLEKKSSLAVELEKVEALVAELNDSITEMKRQLKGSAEEIQISAEISRNPVIENLKNRLIDLNLERQRLERKFPGKSRPVQTVLAEIEKVQEMINREQTDIVSKVVKGRNSTWVDIYKTLLRK